MLLGKVNVNRGEEACQARGGSSPTKVTPPFLEIGISKTFQKHFKMISKYFKDEFFKHFTTVLCKSSSLLLMGFI